MPTDPVRAVPVETTRKGPVSARAQRRLELPEYLPARMLNEFVYCPRLFFYEWVEGVFAESADTVEGSLRHEKLEVKSDALPLPQTKERIHSRSVTLTSDTHHLIAKMDLVEGQGGVVSPVDYKKGHPRKGDEGPEAWPADRVQLCVQALILRDNGYRCDEAVAYYDATKQRVRIAVDDTLVAETLAAVEAARGLAATGEIPPPLVDSPKCPRCSLVGVCLPDETVLCETAPATPPDPQLRLFAEDLSAADRLGLPRAAPDHVRRLVPARDDLRPLYITGHGLVVGKTGEVLQIRKRGETVQEVRVNGISQVSVFGNVQLTASAIQGLCWADKPLAHFSYGGWFYGLTQGLGLKNVFLRKSQFARADDVDFCLAIAREIVATKVRNQRTLLQRNHIEPPAVALRQLRHCADLASGAENLGELLGIEGTAARIYFECLPGMLKVDEQAGTTCSFTFDFRNRNRRPPRDPVNALLSFAYSLLGKDLTIVCHTIGFDPFIGFFHQPRFGRPALALDLMEGFRPLIADSAVLTAINTGMVSAESFVRVGSAVSLSAAGRKAFLRAYEQRMDALVTHPLFGYRANYRRVLEIQARLLARVVTGELLTYPGFETR
jgi:CRISPR-associated protein Cas1